MFQQQIERSLVETGVFGLQHEVILIVGSNLAHEGLSLGTLLQTVVQQLLEAGTPPAEIVVHINRREARLACTRFQITNVRRDIERLFQQLIAARVVKVIQNID